MHNNYNLFKNGNSLKITEDEKFFIDDLGFKRWYTANAAIACYTMAGLILAFYWSRGVCAQSVDARMTSWAEESPKNYGYTKQTDSICECACTK